MFFNIQWGNEEKIMEKKHEMMSLEDSEQLKGRMKFFEQELLKHHHIDPNLYVEYDVKRGLRDSAGKGVLTGLTEISDVTGFWLFLVQVSSVGASNPGTRRL